MPELSCILLAGPNGSGKSSAFAKLDLEGVWINADEIANAMPAIGDGKSTDIQAGRAALRYIAEMIETRKDPGRRRKASSSTEMPCRLQRQLPGR